MTTGKIVGIDYSLSCPAVCVLDDTLEFNRSKFYFLSNRKRDHARFNGNIEGFPHSIYKTDEERYDQISRWVLDCFQFDETTSVFVEGYSMGSKGLIFNLAENCGLLKHKLYKKKVQLYNVPPTVVKKFATGKGNSDKLGMYNSFIANKKNPQINSMFAKSEEKINSPTSDIVDAYFIALYGANKLQSESR